MPFGVQPKYIFRDNDAIYGNDVRAFLDSCGIEEVRTAYRSPWQNPFVERFIGTLRRELIDHVIVLSQRYLERLLQEFIKEYYHVARPHQGLNGGTPMPHNNATGNLRLKLDCLHSCTGRLASCVCPRSSVDRERNILIVIQQRPTDPLLHQIESTLATSLPEFAWLNKS